MEVFYINDIMPSQHGRYNHWLLHITYRQSTQGRGCPLKTLAFDGRGGRGSRKI